ncbi:PREDICTED: uncharacterized protein LOC18592223 [Theobroma cacao]|uniref:Uncharacterized protein LOC18592223 n=1 Tax=Theobroma cacao TaxID=3641 RepID=A0AB32WMV1_THECC|nr:PREDICTED: uncharacterized protein LOC18592223 [Theobroma cacao]
MANKPSRGLVLYGDGLARFIEPSHAHLHSLASKANCGFLSLPNAPPSESEDDRIVREFAVLMDACEAYFNQNGQLSTEAKFQKSSLIPTMSDRFMGMRAALLTNSYELLGLLGFQEGKILDTSQFDLVIVHIGSEENLNDEKGKGTAGDIEFMNALLGAIMHVAQLGTEIASCLHLSLVMSYGYVSKVDEFGLSILSNNYENNSPLSTLFPHQSLLFVIAGSRVKIIKTVALSF